MTPAATLIWATARSGLARPTGAGLAYQQWATSYKPVGHGFNSSSRDALRTVWPRQTLTPRAPQSGRLHHPPPQHPADPRRAGRCTSLSGCDKGRHPLTRAWRTQR